MERRIFLKNWKIKEWHSKLYYLIPTEIVWTALSDETFPGTNIYLGRTSLTETSTTRIARVWIGTIPSE
jgi:hypothetical protein